MLLSFLRHAEAEDVASSDFERKLTPKGLEQADKVGKFCARYGLVPGVILSSPVIRAEQTARVVARKLGDVRVEIEPWLACGMNPDTLFDGLRAYANEDEVMVVGHEPDFSEAISALIGAPSGAAITIRKASLTAVDVRALRAGGGRLQFSAPVRLM